jgi:rsbT antagonist protein RsbS
MEYDESTEAATIQKLETLLLVSVPRDLLDDQVLGLRREVLHNIRRYNSQWVLLDFSLVDICDSFYGRFIQSVAQMVKLTGAQVIVSGLQDAVVETLVDLGLTLNDIHAVLDLDDALALSRESEHGNWPVDNDPQVTADQGWLGVEEPFEGLPVVKLSDFQVMDALDFSDLAEV